MASPSAFQTLPFLIDVKLDRTSVPLSERSVVMVISPLVYLSEAIFKVLVCLSTFSAILSGRKHCCDICRKLVTE